MPLKETLCSPWRCSYRHTILYVWKLWNNGRKGTDQLKEICCVGSHVAGGYQTIVCLITRNTLLNLLCGLWSHCAIVCIAHIRLWDHSRIQHALIHMVCCASDFPKHIWVLVHVVLWWLSTNIGWFDLMRDTPSVKQRSVCGGSEWRHAGPSHI